MYKYGLKCVNDILKKIFKKINLFKFLFKKFVYGFIMQIFFCDKLFHDNFMGEIADLCNLRLEVFAFTTWLIYYIV